MYLEGKGPNTHADILSLPKTSTTVPNTETLHTLDQSHLQDQSLNKDISGSCVICLQQSFVVAVSARGTRPIHTAISNTLDTAVQNKKHPQPPFETPQKPSNGDHKAPLFGEVRQEEGKYKPYDLVVVDEQVCCDHGALGRTLRP